MLIQRIETWEESKALLP